MTETSAGDTESRSSGKGLLKMRKEYTFHLSNPSAARANIIPEDMRDVVVKPSKLPQSLVEAMSRANMIVLRELDPVKALDVMRDLDITRFDTRAMEVLREFTGSLQQAIDLMNATSQSNGDIK